tara:strand:- start:462 stop:635 length:174 start_codon:yes stop_codon:yes gene_type:complete
MTLADRGDNDLEEVIHRLKKRNKELEKEIALEKEDRQYNDLVHKRELADLFKGKNET